MEAPSDVSKSLFNRTIKSPCFSKEVLGGGSTETGVLTVTYFLIGEISLEILSGRCISASVDRVYLISSHKETT